MTDGRAPDREIIVFDGMCVLCSANARFVLRHDRAHHFALAAMQGRTGSETYRKAGIDPSNPETLVVVTLEGLKRDSDAVLHIYSRLGWPWRAVGILKLVPKRVRDTAYRAIARNRYRLFGQRESCWIPDPADRDRLLP